VLKIKGGPSISEALEHNTSFDSTTSLEFTTHAIKGVVFE
jgi:hypothetical protein